MAMRSLLLTIQSMIHHFYFNPSLPDLEAFFYLSQKFFPQIQHPFQRKTQQSPQKCQTIGHFVQE